MHAETIAQRRVIRNLAGTFETRLQEQHESIKGEIQQVVGGAFDRLTTTLQDMQVAQKQDESDSESDDEFTNIMTFNYALHNENVDGVFQLPTTEDIQISEKGWA